MKSVILAKLQEMAAIPNLPAALYDDLEKRIKALEAEGVQVPPPVSEEVGQAWLESVLARDDGRLQ